MATSSGNSCGSSQIQNTSGCEERKRKRMASNRESARRSRMRKQKHLDDLTAQITQLKKENNQISSSINITTQHFLKVESENSVLNAQMMELSQRLQSLNEIISFMNINNGGFEAEDFFQTSHEVFGNNNSWNLMYFNQPIMASADADMFQY